MLSRTWTRQEATHIGTHVALPGSSSPQGEADSVGGAGADSTSPPSRPKGQSCQNLAGKSVFAFFSFFSLEGIILIYLSLLCVLSLFNNKD